MPWIFSYAELGPHNIKDVIGKVPFTSLSASLPKYKVVFKGKSRKWGGALATIEKARRGLVYGSALFVSPADIKILDRCYQFYDRKQISIFIEATQDKVKAYTYIISTNAPYGAPSQDYIKNIVKHLKFFWGQNDKKNLSLEDFGITTAEVATTKVVKAKDELKTKSRRKSTKS